MSVAPVTTTGDAELDELLAQQQQFLSSNEAPAARVRRGRRTVAADDVPPAAAASARPTPQQLAPGSGASPEVITQALRDVTLEAAPGGRSRSTGVHATTVSDSQGGVPSAQAPSASITRLSAGRTNPAPAHVAHNHNAGPGRSAAGSVVPADAEPPVAQPQVLGDIVERSPSAPPTAPSAPRLLHGSGFPAALHRSQWKRSGSGVGAVAPGVPSQPDAVGNNGSAPLHNDESRGTPAAMEGAGIEAEVHARLASMTHADVDAALAELRQRLTPDKLAFLQRRGQRRAAEPRNVGDAGVTAAAGGPQLSRTAPPLKLTAPSHVPPVQVSEPLPDDDTQQLNSGAAGVRFTMNGHVLPALEPQQAACMPSSVSRDPLRMEGDPETGGYTIADVVNLCRSAVPAQRVAGLRGMVCILKTICAGMARGQGDAHEDGVSHHVNVPGVSWPAVYVHAVKTHRMALLLRTALDDSATSVVAAAAAATAALVADETDELEWEALDSNVVGVASGGGGEETYRHGRRGGVLDGDDAASCGRHPGQPFCRARAGMPWDPVVPWPDTTTNADSGEDGGDSAGPVDADASDPCQALIRMQIVARVRFLLEAAQHGAAAHSLLSVLIALARHSANAAQAVACTPRLMLTLRTCFVEATPPGGAPVLKSDDGGLTVTTTSPDSPQPPEFWLCRPLALKLLRILIEVGGAPVVAAAALEGLVVACVSRFSPMPLALTTPHAASRADYSSDHGAAHDAAALRREALRMWRRVMRTDARQAPVAESYFPVFVSALEPPTAAADAAWWDACREVYRLLIVTHSGDVSERHRLSPAAAQALATAACRWATADVTSPIIAMANGSTRDAALAALAAALQYVRLCASDQQAAHAAVQVAAAFCAPPDTDVAAPGPLRQLLSQLVEAAHAMRPGAHRKGCFTAALAPLSACLAVLATLRRGASMPAAAHPVPNGAASCDAAARHVAFEMSTALDAVLAATAATDDASKEDWLHATHRATLATLCSAQVEALGALSGTSGRTAATSMASTVHVDVVLLRRVVHAASHVVGAAPYGCDALAARAVEIMTSHGAMTSQCGAGLDSAAAASAVPGSAAHAEAASAADGARSVQSLLPLRPPVRGACRSRLLAAAGLKPDGGRNAASGSRLPAPASWPYRALGVPSGASEWAIDAATGASVSLIDGASHEVSAALLALLLALEDTSDAFSSAQTTTHEGVPHALAQVPPAVKLRLLSSVFAASPDGVLRHPAVRLTCAALTDVFTCQLRRDAARNNGASDDPDPLAAEASATDVVHRFADASFGDTLHGRHVALALRARSPVRARVAALHALLVDKQVAHLLPPVSAFQFSCPGMTDCDVAQSVEDLLLFTLPDGDPSLQVLRMWTDFLLSGREFDRAAAAHALPVDMATHAVRCALRELMTPPSGVDAALEGTVPPRRSALLTLAKAVASGAPEPLRAEAAAAVAVASNESLQ